MAIYLHIGMHKTGTTSLQRSMAAARATLLKRGILYPSGTLGLNAKDTDAHHFLAHAINGRRTSYTPDVPFDLLEAHCNAMAEAAAAHKGPTILSSEDFSHLRPAEVKQLAELLPSETKIIVYFRRQDYWADSLYGQMLKTGRSRSIEDFLKKQNGRLNYSRFLQRWKSAFGKDSLIVRTYEGDVQENLWPDFCEAIGQPEAISDIPVMRNDNPSLTKQQARMLQVAESIEVRKQLRKKYERINRSSRNSVSLRYLPASIGADLVERYKKSNQAVARQFLGRDDLFMNTTPAIAADDERFGIDAILDLIGEISKNINSQIRSLRDQINCLRG